MWMDLEGTSLVARAWQPTSCLENPLDKGAWWTIVTGSKKSEMPEATEHSHTDLEGPYRVKGSQTEKGEIVHALLKCGL